MYMQIKNIKNNSHARLTVNFVYFCAIFAFYWSVLPNGIIIQETISCQWLVKNSLTKFIRNTNASTSIQSERPSLKNSSRYWQNIFVIQIHLKVLSSFICDCSVWNYIKIYFSMSSKKYIIIELKFNLKNSLTISTKYTK